jgi:hypothetical protein
MVRSSLKPGGGVVCKSPPSSFLRREFRLPSVPFNLSGCASPIAEKGVIFRSDGLIESQKWPVGFVPSGEIVVWDQGDEVWVGEEGDFPYPWVSILPTCPWIGCRMVLRMKIRPSCCWMPSMRISIGLKRVSFLRLKGGERC